MTPSRVFTPQARTRERASVVPTVSQPSADAPLIPQVGGFALAAIAHIPVPKMVKQ